MTTTCEISPKPGVSADVISHDLEVTVLKTEVKDSSISKLPGLSFVDDLSFPTELAIAAFSFGQGAGAEVTVDMQTELFSGGGLRVSKAPDGNFFIWTKEDDEAPQ